MKTIIISIGPEWCEKILNGEKIIEVRKTAPKPPFKVYIYCTKGRDSLVYSKDPEDIAWCKPFIDKENNRVWTTHNSKLRKYCKDREWNGKVVAEFVCNNVEDFSEWEYDYPSLLRHIDLYAGTKGDYRFLDNYLKGNKKGYALHITDLNIYDKPKELGEFYKPCIMPEMPYCPACKYGNVQYSPDEVECASDLEGASCEWLCLNSVKRPPQSYMRIQDPKEM